MACAVAAPLRRGDCVSIARTVHVPEVAERAVAAQHGIAVASIVAMRGRVVVCGCDDEVMAPVVTSSRREAGQAAAAAPRGGASGGRATTKTEVATVGHAWQCTHA